MQLSQIKALLPTLKTLSFRLEDGTKVPSHFHVTEVGMVNKKFIDCGGVIRTEKVVSFQLWTANDFDHRLSTQKLLDIILLSEKQIALEDAPVEVEYQSETIGKYSLSFDGECFVMQNKKTACLAEDQCGIPVKKIKVNLSNLNQVNNSCCGPNSQCC